MAPGANSYSTAASVAALSRRYTNAGTYDGTTNPTLTVVEGWIDSVSATLNAALAGAGFTIPVTQADAVLALAAVVAEAVSDLTHAANSAGRFFTERALERGVSPMRVVRQEMKDWVDENAAGLTALGAARTSTDQRSSSLSAGVITLDLAEHSDGTSTVDE
jgi:hypothetical protein